MGQNKDNNEAVVKKVQYHWCGPLCSHHLVLRIFLLLIHSHCAVAECRKPSLNAGFICRERHKTGDWSSELFHNVLIPWNFHYSAELTLVYIFYICRVLQDFSQSLEQQGCLVVSICDVFSLLEHLIQSCWLHLQSVRTLSFRNSLRQAAKWKIQNESPKSVIKKLIFSFDLAQVLL